VNVPDYFEGIDIQSFAETWDYTFNETGSGTIVEELDVGEPDGFGGYDIDLYYREANYSDKFVALVHHWREWVILPYVHDLNWRDSTGLDVTETIEVFLAISIDTIESDMNEGIANYIIFCDHLQANAFFGYNTTTYSSFQEAWDYGEASIMLGIGFDQIQTGTNAWNIISMLLFFQLPAIHWVINALLVIPFWICIAYLAYVLVIKVIPLIAGG